MGKLWRKFGGEGLLNNLLSQVILFCQNTFIAHHDYVSVSSWFSEEEGRHICCYLVFNRKIYQSV